MKLYSHVSDVHSLEVLSFRLRQREKKHWNESILRQSTETDKDVGRTHIRPKLYRVYCREVRPISYPNCRLKQIERQDRALIGQVRSRTEL